MNLDDISKADIGEIRKALVKCRELEQKIERGMACGQDCTEIKERCEQAKAYLTALNNLYGPQFPPKGTT